MHDGTWLDFLAFLLLLSVSFALNWFKCLHRGCMGVWTFSSVSSHRITDQTVTSHEYNHSDCACHYREMLTFLLNYILQSPPGLVQRGVFYKKNVLTSLWHNAERCCLPPSSLTHCRQTDLLRLENALRAKSKLNPSYEYTVIVSSEERERYKTVISDARI